MRIRLLCVGKPRSPELAALHDDYARRIRRLGATYEAAWVPEARSDGRYTEDHLRERDARALLEALDGRSRVVALDRTGDLMSSERLAELLESWATPRADLIVGGHRGLDPSLLARADRIWSLSPLTFPHELARVLVAEQLYRALTLRRGLPYHR